MLMGDVIAKITITLKKSGVDVQAPTDKVMALGMIELAKNIIFAVTPEQEKKKIIEVAPLIGANIG